MNAHKFPARAAGPSPAEARCSAFVCTSLPLLRALATLAQLLRYDFDAMAYKIVGVPLRIVDAPRFAWRELMVDTARHFLPLSVLRRTVDAMEAAKLNTLHLHLVDQQAFPLVPPSRPLLSHGAYSPNERYTMADLASLDAYARARAVRLGGGGGLREEARAVRRFCAAAAACDSDRPRSRLRSLHGRKNDEQPSDERTDGGAHGHR